MFRKSTIHDLQGVYELICQLVRRELDRDMFARVYAEQMENDDYYCLVAEKDGKLYAVLNLRFDSNCITAETVRKSWNFLSVKTRAVRAPAPRWCVWPKKKQ